MGYITLAGFPSFTKAFISTWFKVSSAAVAAASAENTDSADSDGFDQGCYYPPLRKIIPLMTFGSIESSRSPASAQGPIQPSFIGVTTDLSTAGAHIPRLVCNLQTSSEMDVAGIHDTRSRPECFYMGGNGSRPYTGADAQDTNITPDVWQHAFVSFDLAGSLSLRMATFDEFPDNWTQTVGPQFNWAVNGVDKTGYSMNPGCAQIYTVRAPGSESGDDQSFDFKYLWSGGPFQNLSAQDEGVTSTAGGFSIGSGDFSFPAGPLFTGQQRGVILGPTMVYIDVFEIGADIRELFIDVNGTHLDPSGAIDFFGRVPDIHFNAASDWKSGTNVGSAGAFTVVGNILKSGGDPKIGA